MKKDKFVYSTIILIISGLITKIFGMVIKIATTRVMGPEGMALYMLIVPTSVLFITISQMGFPIAITKFVAEGKKSHKRILFSVTFMSLLINLFLIILLFFLSPYLSNYLVSSKKLIYPLLTIGLIIPLTSISSIIRGYFFGREKMLPQGVSNFLEQLTRFLFIILFVPKILKNYNIIFAVIGLLIANALGEVVSIIVYLFFLPKNVNIKKEDLKPDVGYIKDTLRISIPTTGSRLIGSFSYFFEPIIITYSLLKVGLSQEFIIQEYGALTGFITPFLFLPFFFIQAISTAVIPAISKAYGNNNLERAKRLLKKSLLLSFLIGFFVNIIMFIFPKELLKFIYKTTNGLEYIRYLIPFYFIDYFRVPLVSSLQAIGKTKGVMYNTFISSVLKLISLLILPQLGLDFYGVILAIGIENITLVYLDFLHVKKEGLL